MRVFTLKNCLRCCERTLERCGRSYRCRSCGFIEKEKVKASESVDSFQDRIEKTLDLVEIFDFGKGLPVRGHE